MLAAVIVALGLAGITPTPANLGATAAGASGSSPGTNIGNAKLLTGATTGTLASALADDWYVVFPARLGGAVQFRVKNTTPTNSDPCSSLTVAILDTNGRTIDAANLADNTSYDHPSSSNGSDRYYVELATQNCNPIAGHPIGYSAEVLAGGGGTPPNPAPGSGAAGNSIGSVASPLQGGTVYKGSIASSATDAWYILFKAADANPATVRFENTTVQGSTNCTSLTVSLDDANGRSLNAANLAGNTAITFSIAAGGRYYIELTDQGCTAGGTTYDVEPGPKASEWITPPIPSPGSVGAGNSIGTVASPLRGRTVYKGSIASSATDAWYILFKAADANPATVRFENTTVQGSTDCTSLTVSLDDANGRSINAANLAGNTAITFSIAAGGRYYIELTDQGCTSGGTTYRIEPEPSAEWTAPTMPGAGAANAGDSIGDVGAPLQGGVAYTGSIASSAVQAWFVAYKAGDTNSASIRIENTTVFGSTVCTSLTVSLDDTTGRTINAANLAANTAITFSVAFSGRYYIELTDQGCTGGGTTYRIEPQPPSEWTFPGGCTADTASAPGLRPSSPTASCPIVTIVDNATKNPPGTYIIGQRVQLTTKLSTGGQAALPLNWSVLINGSQAQTSVVGGYDLTNSATLTDNHGRVVALTDTESAVLTLFFVRPNIYTVHINSSSGAPADAQVKVVGPTVSVSASNAQTCKVGINKKGALSTLHNPLPKFTMGPGLNDDCLGAPNGPNKPGISWNLPVAWTTTAPGTGVGQLALVQLLDQVSTTHDNTPCYTPPSRPVADVASFYPSFATATPSSVKVPWEVALPNNGAATWGAPITVSGQKYQVSDSPNVFINTQRVWSRTFTATDYLMYQPAPATTSIWVSLGSMSWSWSGTSVTTVGVTGDHTLQNGAGPTVTPFSTAAAATALPEWSTGFGPTLVC